MTLSLLLAILATSTTVAVWGVLFGLIADEAPVRARAWAIAALGVAIGIAACGEWHGAPSARVISAVVILLGGQRLMSIQRHSSETPVVVSDQERA